MNQSDTIGQKKITADDWFRDQMESIRKKMARVMDEYDARKAAELDEAGEGGRTVAPALVWKQGTGRGQ